QTCGTPTEGAKRRREEPLLVQKTRSKARSAEGRSDQLAVGGATIASSCEASVATSLVGASHAYARPTYAVGSAPFRPSSSAMPSVAEPPASTSDGRYRSATTRARA